MFAMGLSLATALVFGWRPLFAPFKSGGLRPPRTSVARA